MPTCAECGQENPDVARFCLACGSELAAAAEAREERKVVTVLFADLVGFTSRAEGDRELQRALAFYRSADAKAYFREGEALLARTA
jgi:class 3 adenylate cyclase